MPVVQGNISGSIKSVALNIPCKIKSFSLWNRSGLAIVVNVGVVTSGTDRYIQAANLAALGSAGCSVYYEVDISVLANAQILITASGSCDYYFSLE